MTTPRDSTPGYDLLDFGGGRKLERFGHVVLDRPCPAAEGVPVAAPAMWHDAASRYKRTQGDRGVWTPARTLSDGWQMAWPLPDFSPCAADGDRAHVVLTFHLQGTPFGHVGIFPEQHENWQWIGERIEIARLRLGRRPRVLNLFAYTGGSTLAAAAAGAEVVHVDAARNSVDRARRNAELSGLADRPVRWITEDAMTFCRRELKRASRYDGVILDPPSYGHGPKGQPWKISQHLLPLLKLCGELTAEHRSLVLITCHTPGVGAAELSAYLAEGLFGHCGAPPAAGRLALTAIDGRSLPSGVFARWP